ncbi:MAG: hypothetical protein AB7E80_08115 [Hyphomicrobiaceae bacterium]
MPPDVLIVERDRGHRPLAVASVVRGLWVAVLGAFGLAEPTSAIAAGARAQLPEIRTSVENTVPRCVTPDRLMRFLRQRNPELDGRFSDIARWYRHHGERWHVRWDMAFFQMALETNFLSFRRPDGRRGDVHPRQNNFAGLGTTGGGVPGDSFPDVGTGVLAQVQHLVAYSGERIARPVAPRTRLKQDVIVEASLRLRRPVRFSDLARRWAADPAYARSIATIASEYREAFCADRAEADIVPPAPRAVRQPSPRDRHVRTADISPPAMRLGLSADAETIAAPSPRPVVRATMAGGARVADAAPPPDPPVAARASRKRQVVRTIWRRGDPLPTAVAGWPPVAREPARGTVVPLTTSRPNSIADAAEETASYGLMAGLAGLARLAQQSSGTDVRWVPVPRLAQRPD